MNREKAKKLLPIITAFAEGKTIEAKHSDDKWCVIRDTQFNGDPDEYRIQPSYLERHNACGLKVGDRVKVVRSAGHRESGWFDLWSSVMDGSVGSVFTIQKDNGQYGFGLDDKGNFNYPYFVLEKVEPKYRPFANAEEFKPHRDKWFYYKRTCYYSKPVVFREEGVVLGQSGIIEWQKLLDFYTFDDGSPCGVLVTE